MTRSRICIAAIAVALLSALSASSAFAAFPYTRPSGNPTNYQDLYLDDTDLTEGGDFKLSATADPTNTANASPVENGGIRGARVYDSANGVDTAFRTTLGRPDVSIAVMDSGIKWNDPAAMSDLRHKVRLTKGELPMPDVVTTATPLDGSKPCSQFVDTSYDANGDGAFNVSDYACDPRVNVTDPRRVGPPGVLVPQDVTIAFSDPSFVGNGPAGAGTIRGGVDDDNNGFVDDIAGWDFLDNDNDPFDDVLYGHGTGEAQDSSSEVNNGGDIGTCPNCMVVPIRVGDSFIADINRFAQGVIYAADNNVQVVQSALGTLNNSSLARAAVDYAYRHGTTSVVSAADEAAQHNNQPYLPHTILVNSVRDSPLPPTSPQGKSYLTFNGCTNFNAKITLAIPSTSCSSNAVGLSAGYAGLVYSAAYTAAAKGALTPFDESSLCQLNTPNPVTNDTRCVITPNEVRQVMASGRINPPADISEGYQAEDVNFAGAPPGSGNESSCQGALPAPAPATPVPGCTNPQGPGGPGAGALQLQIDLNRTALAGLQAVLRSYPARNGHDQFYGYGRVNMVKAVDAVLDDPAAASPGPSRIPPDVEIFSPQWNQQVDPAQASFTVRGQVYARGSSFTCQVYVAPGQYPNNRLTTAVPFPGDFAPLGTGACNGSTPHTTALDGDLATIDLAALKARFPADTKALNFAGREPGAEPQQSNGRPANDPYGFVVKVVATRAAAGGLPLMTGEDQRAAYLHRDQDMLPGFPRGIRRGQVVQDSPTGDGESSPLLVDLDGDNRAELVFGGSDGFVHALRRDGTELPGWPVRGDQPPLHLGGRAFSTSEPDRISSDIGGAMLSSIAADDVNRDGIPEVFGADVEGKVYGWSAAGERIFTQESNINFSGKPLAPFQNVRYNRSSPRFSKTRRTQHGFFASPVLANLDGRGGLEIIAASLDRHVYAWHLDGTPVQGFPMLVVDRTKLDASAPNGGVDPTTNALTFAANSGAQMQGAIIDTPAVADLLNAPGGADDGQLEIVVGTNEEYAADADGGFNSAGGSFSLLNQATAGLNSFCAAAPPQLCANGVPVDAPLKPGNSRMYAIYSDGSSHAGDPDGYLPGWPKKLGIVLTELLPVVGEGVTGNPVVANATCPSGGDGKKVGTGANNGPAYVFNADGSSCYGSAPGGDLSLQTDGYANQVDHPLLPAVGNPAFGDLEGAGQLSFITAAAGLVRALDLALPEYQQTGQDFLGAWSVETGAGGAPSSLRANYPQAVNDLQFLTGPAISDIDPNVPGQETIEGTASKDLQAFSAAGVPPATPGVGNLPKWPKVTTDWTVATPTVGSWGTLDTVAGANKVVVGLTRSGYLNAYSTSAAACSPSASPRFHHDNANSGDYERDAVLPGRPMNIVVSGTTVSFTAPGDDLLCGTATRYQVASSDNPIDESTFTSSQALSDQAPAPTAPGSTQSFSLGTGFGRFVAIRAVDDQGNVGRIAIIDRGPGTPPIGPGGSGGGTGGGGGGPGPGPGPANGPCANLQRGSAKANVLKGTPKGDRLLGLGGKDKLSGLGGDDCVNGGFGNDKVYGGADKDKVVGQRGRDILSGGAGIDTLYGNGGRDRLSGGPGRDRLLGGIDQDVLNAKGGGRDVVDCGVGRHDVAIADKSDKVRRCETVRR